MPIGSLTTRKCSTAFELHLQERDKGLHWQPLMTMKKTAWMMLVSLSQKSCAGTAAILDIGGVTSCVWTMILQNLVNLDTIKATEKRSKSTWQWGYNRIVVRLARSPNDEWQSCVVIIKCYQWNSLGNTGKFRCLKWISFMHPGRANSWSQFLLFKRLHQPWTWLSTSYWTISPHVTFLRISPYSWPPSHCFLLPSLVLLEPAMLTLLDMSQPFLDRIGIAKDIANILSFPNVWEDGCDITYDQNADAFMVQGHIYSIIFHCLSSGLYGHRKPLAGICLINMEDFLASGYAPWQIASARSDHQVMSMMSSPIHGERQSY